MTRGENMKNIREQAVERFICVDRLHRKVFDCTAAKMGMHRGQHMVLVCLLHMPEPPNQAKLAKELGISQPAMASMLNRLEEGGYIRREADPSDRRNTIIVITENGRNILEATRVLFNSIDMSMFEGMGDDMLSSLVESMTVMEANLQKIYTTGVKTNLEKMV